MIARSLLVQVIIRNFISLPSNDVAALKYQKRVFIRCNLRHTKKWMKNTFSTWINFINNQLYVDDRSTYNQLEARTMFWSICLPVLFGQNKFLIQFAMSKTPSTVESYRERTLYRVTHLNGYTQASFQDNYSSSYKCCSNVL